MDYIAKTQQAYDTDPDKYAAATGSMINSVEMEIMLKHLKRHDAVILDLGCGPGRDTKLFSDKGYRVIGVDLSKGLINKARELFPELEFKLMDTRKLEFPDNTFDAIWSNAVLHHLKDKDLKVAFSEIHRILKPGGIIAISFKEGDTEKEVMETFSANLSRFYNFKTEDTLNALLRQSGFKIVTSHVLNERERFGPKYRDLNWVWSFAAKP